MRTRILLLMAVALWVAVAASAQSYAQYFHTDEMPNAVNYLPPPPDTTSVQFAYDMSQYYWGKSIRDTERGDTAIDDHHSGTASLCRIFSEPFGMELSKEATPAIYAMLSTALTTVNKGASKCKEYYHRRRPFQRFNEEVATGESLGETSYPSGHTTKGWAMALLLVELNPEAQDAILKRGYEYGQSRVIVGAHWQSDVDAGRVVGSACYARLHSSAEFRNQMAEARKEYQRLKGIVTVQPSPGQVTTTIPETAITDVDDEQWYTIDGRPAIPKTQGIVVGQGKKIAR